MTVTISVISMTNPTSNIRSLACVLKSRRDIPSSAMMTMCPPSRMGTGRRFSIPRFSEIIDIRLSSARNPNSAAPPDSCAIPTGPTSCFGEVSAVNSPTSVWKIIPDHS